MKVKYIITDCWMNYAFKNKLHEYVVSTIDKKCIYQTLFDDTDFEAFLHYLKEKVDKANALYPRCKSVEIQVDRTYLEGKQILLYCDSKGGGLTLARYTIELVRKEWEVSNER